MNISGATILIEELKRAGVMTLFGYPGGSILPVYDALYRDDSIEHILSADERGAVFMADGYARASGKTGVCLATSGPGATNLVTGIASAFMDSIPMVVITGNVAAESLGRDCFQEVDTTGITMPVTKYNYIVKSAGELSYAVAEAFMLASSGRKGPVLVDIAYNALTECCDYTPANVTRRKTVAPIASEIKKAAEIINSAQCPLIYAGGGVVAGNTSHYALALAEKLNAPIGTSMMGIGAVPHNVKNFIGVGTAVNRLAKEVLKECDVFVSLGARFSEKASEKTLYGKKVKLVHLDIDAAEIGKIHLAEGAVRGDLSETLPLLIDAVNAKDGKWLNEVDRLKSLIKESLPVSKRYIKCLNNHFGCNMIVTTDVGQHQLWTANYFNFDAPRRFLTSGGLGAMGYGLGAAIGAYFATKKPVLMITGDGSFNMNFNELITVKKYNVPVTIAVMNNSALGLIREVQNKDFDGRFVDSDIAATVDYSVLANAFGLDGYRAKSPDELKNILSRLDAAKPAVIDCIINKNEKAL